MQSVRSLRVPEKWSIDSFCCSGKYLTPPVMLYIYKRQICPNRCYIWAEAAQSFSSRDIQNRLRSMVGYFPLYSLFPHRRNATSLSLFYRHFFDKCSDELHTLVQLVQIFIAKARHVTSTESKRTFPPYSICEKEACFFHKNSYFEQYNIYL